MEGGGLSVVGIAETSVDARKLHVRCVSKVLILQVSGSHDPHRTGTKVGQTGCAQLFIFSFRQEIYRAGCTIGYEEHRLLHMPTWERAGTW